MGAGPGLNQLDKLVVDADAHGLAVGIEGLWEWQKNALVLLIDVDFGASTGPASLNGALSDTTGTANPGRVITALPAVVVFQVDADGDGVADGNKVPTRLP